MKKSVNSRMAYARENNQFAAFSPKESKITQKAPPPIPPHKPNRYPPLPPRPVAQAQPVEEPKCICNRKSQIIECTKCKMLCYGRVSEPCPFHPNVTYLLDLFYCPSCICSRVHLKAKVSS